MPNGSGDDGYLPKANMDLDASTMDQDGERPGEGSLCDSDSGK